VTNSSVVATKQWQQLIKYSSTTEDHGLDRDSDEEEEMEEPPGFFKRLYRWMHTNDDIYLEVSRERSTQLPLDDSTTGGTGLLRSCFYCRRMCVVWLVGKKCMQPACKS